MADSGKIKSSRGKQWLLSSSKLIQNFADIDFIMIYDIVQNFLIAHTLAAGRIRFDWLLKQISHREYFLDAIGKLKIAVW